MSRFPLVLLALLFLSLPALGENEKFQRAFIPPAGLVPNANVAIGVARAILTQAYGAANVEEPLTAERNGDAWDVHGTMGCTHCVGGVATIKIAIKDGRVLDMFHGE